MCLIDWQANTNPTDDENVMTITTTAALHHHSKDNSNNVSCSSTGKGVHFAAWYLQRVTCSVVLAAWYMLHLKMKQQQASARSKWISPLGRVVRLYVPWWQRPPPPNIYRMSCPASTTIRCRAHPCCMPHISFITPHRSQTCS